MARIIDSIKGHGAVIKRLWEMQKTSRLYPVLLFIGPSGVGKKTIAKALAQSLVCEASTTCGHCGACLRIEKESSESLKIVQPQGTQIKIDQTRDIQNWLSLRSLGKARIVIIDDAEKLNAQAANSLLKTFEEPPQDVYFILIAPSQSAILTTIKSRAQIIRFGALDIKDLQDLTEAPDWAIISSQGQLNRLQILTTVEYEQMRRAWFEVFHATHDGKKKLWAFALIKELATDRGVALQLVSLWQQFVRDISFLNFKLEPLIHSDRMRDIQDFTHINSFMVTQMQQLTVQAERDLNSNVDRGIVLENLWWKTQRCLETSHA